MKMEVLKLVVPLISLLCLAQYTEQTSHFILVHGAGHGAWSWYKLTALLESTGHKVTALDMAACGINPVPVERVKSFSQYIAPLTRFLGTLAPAERVILVGHSLGGAAISMAMERFPEKVAAAVYATALMPGPAFGYLTIMEKLLTIKLNASQYAPTNLLIGPGLLALRFYQLSPPEDLRLAISLVRASPELMEEVELTENKYGSVPRVFILCDKDLALPEAIQVWMIRQNPPNEVKVINNSDHMVMVSRPLELFSNLLEVAEKYS